MRRWMAGWMLALSVAGWLGFSLFLFGSRYEAVAQRVAPDVLIEEQPVTAASDVTSVLDRLGPDGRTEYAAFQNLDLIHAALAAAVLSIVILFCVERFGTSLAWRGLAAVPIGVFAAECVENLTLSRLIAAYPGVSAGAITILGTATRAKFVFGLVAFVVVVGCIFGAIVGVVRRRGYDQDNEPTFDPNREDD